MDPYDELGVARDATPEDIKRAFRKKAHATHPDRAGGDVGAFQRARAAYDCLKDPEARAEYDTAGQMPGSPEASFAAHVRAEMQTLFLAALKQAGKHGDPLARAMGQIRQQMQGLPDARRASERRIAECEDIRARITKRSPGRNVLAEAVDAEINGIRAEIAHIDEAEALGKALLEQLDDYAYEAPEPAEPPPKRDFRDELADALRCKHWGP